MNKLILYFLSQFSVKIKIAFLILFLVTGVLFWNISYIGITLKNYDNYKHSIDDVNVVKKIENLIVRFQKERSNAVMYLSHNEPSFKYHQNTKGKKYCSVDNFKSYPYTKKKLAILYKSFDELNSIRQSVTDRKIAPDEVVRYYSDSILKHLIDLLALMMQHNNNNQFYAYFALINAIENTSLQRDITSAYLINNEFGINEFEISVKQDAKAQTFLDRFKIYTTDEILLKYYKIFTSKDFIKSNECKNNILNQVISPNSKSIELDTWNRVMSSYVSDLYLILELQRENTLSYFQDELRARKKVMIEDFILLFVPLVMVIFIAYFVFLDIRLSINTLMTFLKRKDENDFTEENQILQKSKSELGEVYRTLFEFDTKIKEQIEVIKKSYEQDSLTKLPNRTKLLKDLALFEKSGKNIDLIYIDINDFSHINDSFGQDVGDKYLIDITSLLKEMVKDVAYDCDFEITIYRLGSDEFALLSNVKKVTNRLLVLLTRTCVIRFDDLELPLSFTCGIASSSSCGNKTTLLSQAEIAQRSAKNSKKHYMTYDKSSFIEEKHETNLKWIRQISKAFEEDLFEIFYQPIIDIKSNVVIKNEVLIRMNKDGVYTSPSAFIDILQDAGHEKKLTKLIISKSFKNFSAMDLELSINMTKDDLDDDMVQHLLDTAHVYNVPHHKVTIEIVESEEILKENYIKIVQVIKSAGFKIAIDDFGTGYSNFAYMAHLRPDYIKIDGSLVSTMLRSDEDMKVIEGICDFAHALNIEVIAEYVSKKEILDAIGELGVEYAQGYYIGKALNFDEITKKEVS